MLDSVVPHQRKNSRGVIAEAAGARSLPREFPWSIGMFRSPSRIRTPPRPDKALLYSWCKSSGVNSPPLRFAVFYDVMQMAHHMLARGGRHRVLSLCGDIAGMKTQSKSGTANRKG